MLFDLEKIATPVVYKILTACVFPRPIAWVSTRDRQGGFNAAPFSFFNAMGSNPPTVVLGLMPDPAKGFKDTANNIIETNEFVVNLVSEDVAEKMNMTAINAPTGVDEFELAGLTPVDSTQIKAPRIAESPVSFECSVISSVVTGPRQTIVIGRVHVIHVADDYVIDADKGYLRTEDIGLIGRTYASGYVRTTDRFDMERPVWKGSD